MMSQTIFLFLPLPLFLRGDRTGSAPRFAAVSRTFPYLGLGVASPFFGRAVVEAEAVLLPSGGAGERRLSSAMELLPFSL